MREMLDTLQIFATPLPKVEANNGINQTVFWSVHATLVQRDLHVPGKARLLWKIYRCSSDSCKAYSVSVSENIGGGVSIFLLPISFGNCIRHLNMQEYSGSAALVNYTFVHTSVCSCLQRHRTCLFFYLPSVLGTLS